VATAALLSFRLGRADGVSIVAARWQRVLTEIGFSVATVAGDGPVDRLVPGLAIDATEAPSVDEVKTALDGFDLVIVENLLTIPMNLPASRVVAEVLRGRRAVLHHHDPPWHRERYAHITELPADDSAWRHVVPSELTRAEMRARAGIDATKIANAFDVDVEPGRRGATRVKIEVAPQERLLLHPSRAIARKNVPAAIALAEATGATYWLTGPAEEGYGPELERLLDGTRVRVLRTPLDPPITLADGYAACDAVVFPSTWEGFGNPPIEAAIFERPVAVGRYPVAEEIRSLGFRWLPSDDPAPLAAVLRDGADPADLAHNRELACRHFSHGRLRHNVTSLLADGRWLP
jgi:mannosylglucosylglycerate synthase